MTPTEAESLRADLRALEARIGAAQPKEWPQEGVHVWSASGPLIAPHVWYAQEWMRRELSMGLLARTKAEAEAIRDRVSAFNKLWAASVASMRNGNGSGGWFCPPFHVTGETGVLFRFHSTDALDAAWASLTDAERKALEG